MGSLGDGDTVSTTNVGLPVSVVEESPFGNFYVNSLILDVTITGSQGHLDTDYNNDGELNGIDARYTEGTHRIPVPYDGVIEVAIVGYNDLAYTVTFDGGDPITVDSDDLSLRTGYSPMVENRSIVIEFQD
jgi:hypothetical protein